MGSPVPGTVALNVRGSTCPCVAHSLPGDTNKAPVLQRGRERGEKEGKGGPNTEPSAGGLLLPQAFFPETFSYPVTNDLRVLFSLSQGNA